MKIRLLFLLFLFMSTVRAQVAIGQWRVHLPFNKAIAVTEAGNRIYCANKTGLFYYDKDDNSLQRMSKINGLSEVNISTINYHEGLGILVIAYTNTNIDLIQGDQIINISDIKRKNIPGEKNINKISFAGDFAYLSCGFGIIEMDLVKKEIKNTWYIGPNGSSIEILDVAYSGKNFYAASKAGIYEADASSQNLSNYNNWKKLPYKTGTLFNTLCWYNNMLYANAQSGYDNDTVFTYDGTTWSYFNTSSSWTVKNIGATHNKLVITNRFSVEVYDQTLKRINIVFDYTPSAVPVQAILDKDDNLWIADNDAGLFRVSGGNKTGFNPGGPGSNDVFFMSSNGKEIWVAPGGVSDTWNNIWKRDGIYGFVNEQWVNHRYNNSPVFDSLLDVLTVYSVPGEDQHIFAGSWWRGLVELKPGQADSIRVFNNLNSSLQKNPGGLVRVGGITMDANRNVWISNSEATRPISVRTADNVWKSFSLPGMINPTTSTIVADSYGLKWIVLPRANGGLIVFNDNNTVLDETDDKYKKLDQTEGNGKLQGNEVLSVAEDLDGQIWVGTDKGVSVFYSPSAIFSGGNFDSQPVYIQQDGHTQYLLETESVTSIVVDGANNKWFGTKNAGVFQMSPDGSRELQHFTEENSPLLSNWVTSIAINHESGEVFFGTDKGIVSYRGTATAGKEEFTNVYVFPNPVREDHEGPIAIWGLVSFSNVKITDISGALVYETKAEGGQAIWNGRNLKGEKVKSGVYLVFCSNNDGSKTHVAKMLILN